MGGVRPGWAMTPTDHEPVMVSDYQERIAGRRGGVTRGARKADMVDVDEVQDLVERAQGGDGGAFGELYERFSPEIQRYLLRQVRGHREAAEDLTEEVFVKALRRLGGYQARGLPFAAWLYRIARNHLIDHVRSTHH